MLQYIIPAMKMLFTVENFIWINLGVFIGSVFAAIPGLTVILCIILFLPFTYKMTAIPGMMFLLGIYCAGGYGGSVSAILINTPNNPSGAVYSAETLTRLASMLNAKQTEYGHDIFLIADEPYREIVFDGGDQPYPSKFYDNTLSCYSYSKSLSLPGERIGYVAVNPRATDAKLIVPMCGQISRGTGHNCPPSSIQLGVAKVIDETSDLSVYETNMNLLYDALTSLGFDVVRPGGTFYIFPKALEEDATAFCMKAKDYDLILVPSESFGVPGYFRMAYCIDTEKVKRSIDALERFVHEQYGK